MTDQYVSVPQVFTLPLRTISALNAREHFGARTRRVKRERTTAFNAVDRRRTGLPCIVKMTRIACSLLDDDNLRGALKGVRDGIADAYEIDDRDPRIEWRYDQAKCKRGHYSVLVSIESKTA